MRRVPSIIDGGVLPEGIHDLSLDEVRAMFASSGERAKLLDRFNQFLQRLQEFIPDMAATLYLDGSFITTWEGCRNIDVILQARDFEGAKSGYLKTLVSARLKREFVDLYKVTLRVAVPGLLNARDYFDWYQNVKAEEAWRFGNDIKALRKGIIRLKL